MRLKLLFLLFSFFSLNILSQEIIISFEGKDQVTSNQLTIDEVKIDNLTTGKTIKIKESSMNLNLTTVLSIGNLDVFETFKGIKRVYPNPINSEATIDFYSEGNSKSIIVAYNIQGKEITRLERKFNVGHNKVEFKPGNAGIYFIKLVDAGKSYYSKVISTNRQSNKASLTYLVSTKKNKKSTNNKTTNTFFTDGDVLKLTATSGNLKSSIYDSPTTTKTYTFNFAENYFKFDKYLVQSEYPSFVNVMFSVTDKNNKGVDYLENNDFEVLENDAKISPSESFRYVKKLNQVPSKLKTVIMLDKSFSVKDDLPKIKAAAINLINQIVDEQEIAIYTFSETPILLADFTSDKTFLEQAINSIEVDFPTTNLYGSIITGLARINNSYSLDGIEEGYLVVLTDGDDTQASSTLQQVINARGNKRVFMVGLGSDLNEANLNQIAFPGNYINAVNADELEAKFEQIRLDMLRFANSFYWLNYMTPKRNNSHTLTVKAIENANTGSNKEITSTFPASGFVSVLSGVYTNVAPGKKYGIEKLDLKFDSTNSILPIDLKGSTYWANDVPKYSWEIDNKDNFNLVQNPNDDSKAVLEVLNNKYSIGNKITLKDTKNNYEKEIEVNIYTTLPYLSISATNILSRSVDISGEVLYKGESDIVNKGIIFYKKFNGNLAQLFKIPINLNDNIVSLGVSLDPNNEYYIQTYAENAQGIGFSEIITINTPTDIPFSKTFVNLKNITSSTLIASARFTDTGGLDLIERGFCWSTTSNPTISDNKVISDLNNGSGFESKIENLEPSTKYYLRSYAINSLGVGYGENEKEFTTTNGEIEKITNGESIFTAFAFNFAFNFNSFEDIVESGVVWSETNTEPTLTDNKKEINIEQPFGVNSDYKQLKGTIENLIPGKLYYYRVYIKTKGKTNYSTAAFGRTLNVQFPFSPSFGVTQIKPTSALLNSNFNSITTNGITITEKGFVLSENENPTINDFSCKVINNNNSCLIENLKPNTIYNYRLYVKTNYGIIYSNSWSNFKTDSVNIFFEEVSHNFITIDSLKFSAKIKSLNLNEDKINERGFVVSLNSNPTINDLIFISNEMTSSFDAVGSDFKIGKKYFYRPYVKTSLGVHYSPINYEFNVKNVEPFFTDISFSDTESTEVLLKGNLISINKAVVLQKGFVYSSVNNVPNLSDTFTESGPGLGDLTKKIVGLEKNTKYYFRPYAKTKFGTLYSNEIKFFVTISETHPGNIILESQSDVDNLSKSIKIILGDIIIGNQSNVSNIESLENLSNIEEIKGSLSISKTLLKDFKGLNNLKIIRKSLTLNDNKNTDLSDFTSLEELGGLFIQNNSNLTDITFPKIIKNPVFSNFYLRNNNSLSVLPNLPNLLRIDDELSIFQNGKIENINFAENLQSVQDINITSEDKLVSINFPKLSTFRRSLVLKNNKLLVEFKFPNLAKMTRLLLEHPNDTFTIDISNNPELESLSGFGSNFNSSGGGLVVYDVKFENNLKIDNFCFLDKFIKSLPFPTGQDTFKFKISGNLYNPSFSDFLNNKCKNN